jgi:hypothetical protein
VPDEAFFDAQADVLMEDMELDCDLTSADQRHPEKSTTGTAPSGPVPANGAAVYNNSASFPPDGPDHDYSEAVGCLPDVVEQAVDHVAGFCARHAQRSLGCETCQHLLFDPEKKGEFTQILFSAVWKRYAVVQSLLIPSQILFHVR